MEIRFSDQFNKIYSKLDNQTKRKVLKQIEKLEENPFAGNPMKYDKKGSRELYIKPFRLSYVMQTNLILINNLYHKDEQSP